MFSWYCSMLVDQVLSLEICDSLVELPLALQGKLLKLFHVYFFHDEQLTHKHKISGVLVEIMRYALAVQSRILLRRCPLIDYVVLEC